MSKKQKRYDILSPDGFSIFFDKTYKTKEDAMTHFFEWKKRYERQGYYSANFGRIPLDELEQHCELIQVD